MFDLSGHNKGESEESGTSYRNTGERTEFKSLNLVDCPTILTGLSREMRTQMNAIVAFSFLLNKDEYTKVEKEEFINQIYNSCNRIISLFDNFLDSAIIETGQSRPGSGICNTNEVFADIYSEFRETLKQEKYKDVVLVTENVAVLDSDHLVDANML
jgi:signal transduction histidine kinase